MDAIIANVREGIMSKSALLMQISIACADIGHTPDRDPAVTAGQQYLAR